MVETSNLFQKIQRKIFIKRPFILTRTLVLVFILSSILQSCSKSSSSTRPKWVQLNQADIYELEDKECSFEEAQRIGHFSDKTKFWILNEYGYRKEMTYDFSKYSLNGLRSHIIENTIIGFEQTTIESINDHTPPTRNKGKILNFCRKNGGYRPNSLENVALSTLFAIDQGHKAYQTLKDKNSLNKVYLLIHPKFSRKYESTNEIKIKVNNASWSYLESENIFLITAFPMEKATSLINLWENPSIFTHEYGHHIFYHHAKKIFNESQMNNTTSTFLKGTNEGFADLFSIYSLRLNKEVKNPKIYFFKYNMNSYRDINNIRLNNGVIKFNKIFDYQQMTYLKDPMKYEKGTIGFEMQEEHNVGAVLAYTFNQVLNQNYYENQSQVRLQKIITWLDQCEQSFDATKSAKVLIENMLKSFVEDNTSNVYKIDITQKYFPYFDQKWNH